MDSPPPHPAPATAGSREDPAGRQDLLECLHLLATGGHGQLTYHSTGGLIRLPITFTSRRRLVRLRPGRSTGSLPPPGADLVLHADFRDGTHLVVVGRARPVPGPGHRIHWRPVRAQRIALSPRHVTRDPAPSRSSGGELT